MKVQHKTFFVTGGASGIGKAIVRALLDKGAQVIAADISKDNLAALEQELQNNNLGTCELNIADREMVGRVVQECIESRGPVDGVINCAGIIQPFVKIQYLDYDAVDRVMSVNFYGTLYVTKAFLPHLLARPEAHIVNVSSMGGFLPVPGQALYGASKAAVKLLSEGLYAELKHTNVHVTIVFPGATNTNITKNSGVETPKVDSKQQSAYKTQSPGHVAAQILAGIEHNKVHVFTGRDSKSMNLLYRLSPVRATNLIANKMKDLL